MKLVFDFGGVLFDWRPTELLKAVLPARAVDDAAARHWVEQVFQGYGGDWGAFDRGELSADEVAARIVERTGLADAEMRTIVESIPGLLTPIAPTVALLDRLRASGLPLYFLSNMPAPYACRAPGARAPLRRLVRAGRVLGPRAGGQARPGDLRAGG
jgi:putative hydrolase of the HAD superfamily